MIEIPDVSGPESAFGTTRFLPDYKDVPEEFRNPNSQTKWNKLFSKWFYTGAKDVVFIPKEGVDMRRALHALGALMRSWEPKHEHKEAGVAYLMSQWFEDWKETAKEKTVQDIVVEQTN